MTKRILAVAALSLGLSASACNRGKDAPSNDEPVVDVDINQDKLEAERRKFIDGARARLKALDEKLATMTDEAADEAEQASDDAIAKARAARDEIAKDLDAAESKTGEEWAKVKTRVNQSLSDLEQAYNDVLSKAQTE